MSAPTGVLEVDVDSRARIRNDLHRNLFVEAGAGTGKTRVLVDRVVRLVATGTVRDVANLVAITFTEAAAAELRDRIRRALDLAAVDPSLPDDEQARCRVARERIDTATITTLHGFAYRILAEHALDAGLPPTFEVDDDVRARVRFLERWTRFRDELFDDPSAARDLLVAHALRLTDDHLRALTRLLHDRWDRLVGVEFPVPELPAVDVSSILAHIDDAVEAAGDRIAVEGDRLADIVDAWAAYGDSLRPPADAGDEVELLRVLDASRPYKATNAGRAELWGPAKAVVVGALNAAVDERERLLSSLRVALVQRLLPRLAAFVLDGVEQRRREGALEFHDLLVHARDLLRRDTHVRVTLSARIDVILIDEFQDTDPLQLDIAFALAAADPSAPVPAWEAARLAEGKLLLVGDPKQSIYRFRGADISLWDRTKRLFPDGLERLGQNFRTVPPLLEWVNRVFTHVIADGADGVQPRYEALAPFRPDVRDAPAVVVVGTCVPEARAIELRQREADDLAKLILTMKVQSWPVNDDRVEDGWRPARFDDIAVLVPTRTPLRQLERTLDDHDIPYRIESRSLVWATDAVRELLSVLAAIDDPDDDVALIAALRAPAFACSDVDLLQWRLAGGAWDHRRPPPDTIGVDHPVAHAMAALAAYHAARLEVPVDELVERVIRERKLVELTFAQRRPRDHWRRLRFVLDQSRAFVEAGGASLGDFVAWAQLQTDESATIVEAPAPEPDDDAVRILTIHGSKGLEFPIVVLAGLSSTGTSNGPRVHFGDERPEVAMGARERRFATPGYEALADEAADAERHEAKRLLYVAATRARDHLVVGVHHAEKGPSKDSPAAVLWRATVDAAAGWWREAPLAEQLALPVAPPASFTPMTASARQAWVDERDARIASAARRRVWSATAVAGDHDTDAVEPVPARGGADDEPDGLPAPLVRGGTALGRAVHAVLQTVELGGRDDVEAIASAARVRAAVENVDTDEVVARVRAALASPVVVEAASATRRWREVYVSAPVAGAGSSVLLEGYIDLLFEDERGELVVVDYKTDRFSDDTAAHYAVQLAAYAVALEATGQRVGRAVLVFTSHDGPVEHVVADLPAAMARARAVLAGGAP